jgi:hypothetical protein
MARRFGTFATIALLATAGTVWAGQAKPQTQYPGAAKPATATAPATKTAAAKPAAKTTALVTTGTIVRFDTASNMLVVSTSQGEQSFALTSSPRIEDGSKTIAAADLAKLTGRTVKVHYTESAGQKNVASVRVQKAMKAAKAAAKSTAKKS